MLSMKNFFMLIFILNFVFLLLHLKHLLILILVFEFLGLKMIFFFSLLYLNLKIYLNFVLLVLFACEASIGLSLLMGVVRSKFLSNVEIKNMFVF